MQLALQWDNNPNFSGSMKNLGPNLLWLLAILPLAPAMAVAKSSPEIPPGLQAVYQQASHQIEVVNEKGKPIQWRAHNAANRLKLEFDGSGVVAHSQEGEWRLRMELTQLGSVEQLKPVERPKVTIEGNRLTYDRGAVQEWYINDPRGLEQGFTLNNPLGKEDLVLQLALEGNAKPELIEKGKAVQFVTPQGKTLRYKGLKAWDANGKDLRVAMSLKENTLQLQVAVADAAYPITIDPLLTLVETQKLPAPVITNYACNPDVVMYCPNTRILVEGDTAVIARPNIVHIYAQKEGEWVEQAKLVSPDEGRGKLHCFGCKLSFSGNTLVVVENRLIEGYSSDRSVYVYTRKGESWAKQAKLPLTPSDHLTQLDTDISGDTIVVAHYPRGGGDRIIHVFAQTGTAWAEQAQLTPEGVSGNVRIYSDTIIAPSHSRLTIYARRGEAWFEQAVLPERNPTSIKEWIISDNKIWIKYSHPTKLFDRFSRTGDIWIQDTTITSEDLPESISSVSYAMSISESSDIFVSGGSYLGGSYDNTVSFGGAHILTWEGGHFTHQESLVPSEPPQYDASKYQPKHTIVNVINDNAIILQAIAVSIPGKEPVIEGDIGAGHSIVAGTYLFTRTENIWAEQAKLTASEGLLTTPFIPGSIGVSMDTALLLGTRPYNGALAYGFDLSHLIIAPPQESPNPEQPNEEVLPDQEASNSGGGALGYLLVLLPGFMRVVGREGNGIQFWKASRLWERMLIVQGEISNMDDAH
jgi:hypothetical protein